MPVGVQQAKERRDETVVGQVLDELIIDVTKGVIEVRTKPQRDAQHGPHLGAGTSAPSGYFSQVAKGSTPDLAFSISSR